MIRAPDPQGPFLIPEGRRLKMNDEEIAVKLEGHEHEIGSLKHRMRAQEDQAKAIQSLVVSVEKLALNMENMLEEQRQQGERLKVLEEEPKKQWSSIKKTIFTSIISTVAGALAAALIMAVGPFL